MATPRGFCRPVRTFWTVTGFGLAPNAIEQSEHRNPKAIQAGRRRQTRKSNIDSLADNGMRPFVSCDLFLVFERKTDVVEPVQQAFSPEWLDVDFQREAMAVGKRAAF